MCNAMSTAQFLTLLIAVLGGQFGVLYYLSSRIDRIDEANEKTPGGSGTGSLRLLDLTESSGVRIWL